MILRNIKNLKYAAILCGLLVSATTHGQAYSFSRMEWNDPNIPSIGAEPQRTEFISYETRAQAEKDKFAESPYFMALKMERSSAGENPVLNANVDIPYMWLDRQVFLHVDGLPAYYVKINGRTTGYGEDSRTPTEFNISRWITDGDNSFELDLMPQATGRRLEATTETASPDIYIYSQPMIRIEDFVITTEPDTASNDRYLLKAQVALANGYNSAEPLKIGYDIYSPKGDLIYYDLQEMEINGNGRDTIIFEQIVNGVSKNLWSSENPALYSFTLYIRYDNRVIEYIPYKVGFGTTETKEGVILRNGKPIAVNAVKYNGNDEQSVTAKDLAALKKAGYNTVWPDYPQPDWFYDICETSGLYVIDQANINSTHRVDDRNVGGAYSNDPAWLGSFRARTENMYLRNRNRPCIIGWSLGGNVGNGYNMYKTYLWLKERENDRAVIFNDAQGEWNTDMVPISTADGAAVLGKK